MKTIWKWDIPIDDSFWLEMPRGAQMLTVQVQRGAPRLWALVDTRQPKCVYLFRLAGTGHMLSEEAGQYVGTFQIAGGDLVLHVFLIGQEDSK